MHCFVMGSGYSRQHIPLKEELYNQIPDIELIDGDTYLVDAE